jgi:hypothetical protein
MTKPNPQDRRKRGRPASSRAPPPGQSAQPAGRHCRVFRRRCQLKLTILRWRNGKRVSARAQFCDLHTGTKLRPRGLVPRRLKPVSSAKKCPFYGGSHRALEKGYPAYWRGSGLIDDGLRTEPLAKPGLDCGSIGGQLAGAHALGECRSVSQRPCGALDQMFGAKQQVLHRGQSDQQVRCPAADLASCCSSSIQGREFVPCFLAPLLN